MSSIDALIADVQPLFTTIANQLAVETGVVQRKRTLSGASLLQTLVFGWVEQPAATLSHLTEVAAARGAVLTPQALNQRFTPALVTCLERFFAAAVSVLSGAQSAEPVAIPLLQRFSGVWIIDSTTLSLPAAATERWPGCGGRPGEGLAAVKVTARIELVRGASDPLELSPGRTQDRASVLQHAPLPAGSLRLSDLGYFTLAIFRQIADADSFFLTRVPANLVVCTSAGERIVDLPRWLARQMTTDGTVDVPVLLGAAEQLPVRLLAERVPDSVAAERRRRIQQAAKKKGQMVSQAALARADWTLLVTNAPVERLHGAEARGLAHARWQIELLFKRWKQDGQLDRWRSANPDRILVEVYAKLIGWLLQHRLVLLGDWSVPHKSLTKAYRVIRNSIRSLALAFDHQHTLRRALAHLPRALRAATSTGCRKKRPSTADILLAVPNGHLT
ncbi:MAG TPA: IS4 family transposase [Hyphomicrobiaceae bacterium]|jgi:hypothetical protein|nr:IS4 family transposase [Hyphomicrobiaceae bacterium]